MKRKRDSVKFIGKILCLIILLIAGYIRNNQSNSAASKGAVDLIIENGTHDNMHDINAPAIKKINV